MRALLWGFFHYKKFFVQKNSLTGSTILFCFAKSGSFDSENMAGFQHSPILISTLFSVIFHPGHFYSNPRQLAFENFPDPRLFQTPEYSIFIITS